MTMELSLQGLMRDMARRVSLHEEEGAAVEVFVQTEVEAYISVDPVLANLYKHYRDVRQRYEKLASSHGKEDPMTEVAADIMESADSALQTRIIELRENTQAQEEISHKIILLKKEEERKFLRQRQDYTERLMDFYGRGSSRFQKEKQAKDDFFLMMIVWFFLQGITGRAVRRLSLANDFMAVSFRHDVKAAA